MTSTTELSDSVADAFGLPRPTVALHTRNLREAGILTRGGRGRSAARMTYQDATSLLIAVAGSGQVQESVEAVSKFSDLAFDHRRSRTKLPGLSGQHTFSEAVIEFIKSFATGALRGAEGITFDVRLIRPQCEAHIEGAIDENHFHVVYCAPRLTTSNPHPDGDLQITTRFTQVTIWQIGELLRN